MKTGLQDMLHRSMYRQYLQHIDGRAILEKYHAENCTEGFGDDGTTEIRHSCLIDRVEPHHTNGDAHPSASLNLEKKLYHCRSGGWSGDLLHLLAKLHDQELTDVLPHVGQFFTAAATDIDDFRAKAERILAGPGAPLEMACYSERILDNWDAIHPYLYEERGIDPETCRRLRIGYDPQANRVVFPAFHEGRLVGWQKRAIPDRPGRWPGTVPPGPKYLNAAGFPKSETIFNLDNVTGGRVVVVESPMSVAKAVSLGFPNTVSTWGAKTSARQAELLLRRGFRHIILWFDSGPAGEKGVRQLLERLYQRGPDIIGVVIPDTDRDLGDCDAPEQVQAKLLSAIPATVRMAEYARAERYRR